MSRDCIHCMVRPVCNGGCPKHRFELSSDGKRNKNYLCEGFRTHLFHAVPEMKMLLSLLKSHMTPGEIRREMKTRCSFKKSDKYL